jgi:hypothetical protein
VDVPAHWPVYDLAREPQRCVRFDVHAVYLGAQSAEARCPASAVGRTETVHVAPGAAGTAPVVHDGGRVAQELTATLPGPGVQVTATYGGDRGVAQAVVASVRARGTAPPRSAPQAPPPPAAPAAQAQVVSQTFTGDMFDTCQAPTTGQMDAWLSSPYRAIGIYIGGGNRACSDGPLSVAWVSDVWSKGWHVAPTYVGRQAPCTFAAGTARFTASSAVADARAAADDAVADLRRFGMGPGRPVYFDMENYDNTQPACRQAVLDFVQAWTDRLHELGYVAGVYGNAISLGADLRSVYTTSYRQPDMIWYANWDGRRTVAGDPYLPDDSFTQNRRIHQYRGDHVETHGGVWINIDSNYADATLAP